MARWADLKKYLHATYKVSDDFGQGVMLHFKVPGGRTQIVSITHHVLVDDDGDPDDWVVVESPFGKLTEVDLKRAITVVGNMVCGGIGSFDEFVTLRDAIPLANLDINEFERPLRLVTSSADELEGMLTGRDAF